MLSPAYWMFSLHYTIFFVCKLPVLEDFCIFDEIRAVIYDGFTFVLRKANVQQS